MSSLSDISTWVLVIPGGRRAVNIMLSPTAVKDIRETHPDTGAVILVGHGAEDSIVTPYRVTHVGI